MLLAIVDVDLTPVRMAYKYPLLSITCMYLVLAALLIWNQLLNADNYPLLLGG